MSSLLPQPQLKRQNSTAIKSYADSTAKFTIRDQLRPSDFRTINVNIKPDKYRSPPYPGNKINTGKYSILTFLPKNLFEQFRRIANFYFLALVFLQSLQEFSVSPAILTAAPITIIVGLTAAKDAFEDWKRHRNDREINRSLCFIAGNIRNENFPLRQSGIWQIIKSWFASWSYRSRKRYIDSVTTKNKNHIVTSVGINTSSTGQSEASLAAKAPLVDNSPDFVWSPTCWQDLRVGDIVYISNNEGIPADILVLSTSEPDCICYVETKNLDGETNLKIRNGIGETSWLKDLGDVRHFKCQVETEPPTTHLYSFSGSMSFPDEVEQNELSKIPLNINNLLLRGCILRNTEWVIGVVLFCGNNTKLMMNSGNTPSKRSLIEVQMNTQVVVNFGFLIALCMFIATGSLIFQIATKNSESIYNPDNFTSGEISYTKTWFFAFFASLILLQNIVPISLYVTTELVKSFQSLFIYYDLEMYYEPYDSPCLTRNWAIADDLGQIEYVFSDKTGTLTRNIMDFRKCSINGIVYGGYHSQNTDAAIAPMILATPKTVKSFFSNDGMTMKSAEDVMLDGMSKYYSNPFASENITFVDSRFIKDLFRSKRKSQRIKDFFTHLAVCHTVLVEYPDENDPHDIVYQAQSPDEAALVSTARDVGFALIDRDKDSIELNILGVPLKFQILCVIEFSSTRKRMSVITRAPDDSILLYCKGADSVIFERLAEGQDPLKEITQEHLEEFANDGLRTLCLAYRVITPEEFSAWNVEYRAASNSLTDRDGQMEIIANKIEQQLTLLGATAIEDQLQEGVPDCISRLLLAGIKVWVLTGDKTETAINIGFSCSLLTKDMILIALKSNSVESTRMQLIDSLKRCFNVDHKETFDHLNEVTVDIIDPNLSKNSGGKKSSSKANSKEESSSDETIDFKGSNRPFALIIDGQSLKHALEPDCVELFLDVASRCKTVICCRVSPLQKAKVVETVKKHRKAMTLAIGDGANDVSMIQAANVGVGIIGLEGRQAVMASDYALGQFRFLGRLLLVHGRWSYRRTALMTLFMFYKNIIWAITLFIFQIYSGWSSCIPFDFFYIQFYNLFFTSLPPIMIGLFDQDIVPEYALAVPQVYSNGIKHELYGTKLFLLYIMDGFYQSLVCFYISYFVSFESTYFASGKSTSISNFGTIATSIAIINANIYMGLRALHWTWLHSTAIIGSPVVFIVGTIIYSLFEGMYISGAGVELILTPFFWLCILLSVIMCQLPRFTIDYYRAYHKPSDVNILREIRKFNIESELQRVIAPPPNTQIVSSAELPRKTEEDPKDFGNPDDSGRISPALRIGTEIGRISKRGLESLRKSSVFFMRTLTTKPNTGFAFSQEPGVANHLNNLGSATIKRRGRVSSLTGTTTATAQSPRRSLQLETNPTKKRHGMNRWSYGGDMPPSKGITWMQVSNSNPSVAEEDDDEYFDDPDSPPVEENADLKTALEEPPSQEQNETK